MTERLLDTELPSQSAGSAAERRVPGGSHASTAGESSDNATNSKATLAGASVYSLPPPQAMSVAVQLLAAMSPVQMLTSKPVPSIYPAIAEAWGRLRYYIHHQWRYERWMRLLHEKRLKQLAQRQQLRNIPLLSTRQKAGSSRPLKERLCLAPDTITTDKHAGGSSVSRPPIRAGQVSPGRRRAGFEVQVNVSGRLSQRLHSILDAHMSPLDSMVAVFDQCPPSAVLAPPNHLTIALPPSVAIRVTQAILQLSSDPGLHRYIVDTKPRGFSAPVEGGYHEKPRTVGKTRTSPEKRVTSTEVSTPVLGSTVDTVKSAASESVRTLTEPESCKPRIVQYATSLAEQMGLSAASSAIVTYPVAQWVVFLGLIASSALRGYGWCQAYSCDGWLSYGIAVLAVPCIAFDGVTGVVGLLRQWPRWVILFAPIASFAAPVLCGEGVTAGVWHLGAMLLVVGYIGSYKDNIHNDLPRRTHPPRK